MLGKGLIVEHAKRRENKLLTEHIEERIGEKRYKMLTWKPLREKQQMPFLLEDVAYI